MQQDRVCFPARAGAPPPPPSLLLLALLAASVQASSAATAATAATAPAEPVAACHYHSAEKLSCMGAAFTSFSFLRERLPKSEAEAGAEAEVEAGAGAGRVRDLSVVHSSVPELREAALRGLRLETLSVTESGVASVHRKAFSGQHFLNFLQLSSNNIRNLHRDTFSALSQLITLSLDDNLLTDIGALCNLSSVEFLSVRGNAITTLEKDSFYNPNLRVLDLSGNEIMCIEAEAFENVPNLEVLDLSDNDIGDIPGDAFLNTSLMELKLSWNKISEVVFTQNISTLRMLILSHNSISTLPRSAFSGATELYHLNLSHNKISIILRSAFDGLLNLGDLDLSYNRISSLHPMTFFGSPYLQRLNLEHNRLTRLVFAYSIAYSSLTHLYLGWNAVSSLQERDLGSAGHTLQVLDLSYNPLSKIDAGVLATMSSLASLRAQHAELEHLDAGALAAATQLSDVDLSWNRVATLAVRGARELRQLVLRANALTALTEATFANVTLEHFVLDLADNAIQEVASRAFHGLEEVASLNLSRNNISFLHDDTFRTLINIWDLDLSYNYITKLNFLRNVSSLRQLNMSYNIIKTIPKHTFISSSIPLLFYLDFSTNYISEIDEDAFEGLKNVWDLNLSNNQISFLTEGTFKDMTSLWDLNLSLNNISSLKWLYIPSLRQLNLSGNSLSVLPESVFSKQNTTVLTSLDLSANGLTTIEDGALYGLRHLERLDLSRNNLSRLPPSALAAPALAHLDLSSNALRVAPALPALPALRTYDLSRNLLSELRCEATGGAAGLRVLRVAYNRLTGLLASSLALPHLQELDLSNNFISAVEARALTGCPELLRLDMSNNHLTRVPPLHLGTLRHLSLSHNEVRELPNDTFVVAGVPALAFFDLSYNALESVDPAAFQPLRLLKYLALTDNALTTLHSGSFANNSVLWALDVSGNRLVQLDVLRDLPGLQHLNASRNALKVLAPKQGGKGRSSRLTCLDLSRNELSLLKGRALAGLGRLRLLDLSHNHLQRIPPAVLDDARRLLALRYNDNPLTQDAAAELGRRAPVAGASGTGLGAVLPTLVSDPVEQMEEELRQTAERRRLRWRR